ncbi:MULTISPECIES: LysR family transcriptional regulator [unclassified Pseudoalteromonas]|uniref:LysR family transcriptional regulator n=1 Tax=unclassified Pseudoalteromonas TaxID=194690 RepID=UPI0005A8401D|nr:MULTISPECIES: LysR family transcriptional regulator [unclassified Pseudoalteromonas]
MKEVSWRAIDLNLLVVFNALMEEKSVSKAANTLHISQSAMSHSLSRLRDLLDDPLFERQGHSMLASQKALDLAPVISGILNQISKQVLNSSSFEPIDFTSTFKIGLTDYAELLFAPVLFDVISKYSPKSQICFYHVDKSNFESVFKEHHLDLMLASINKTLKNFNRSHVYTEKHVCLFDKYATGITTPISLKQYCDIPHALTSSNGQMASPIDAQLAKHNHHRHVKVTSRNFLTLRHLLKGRNLLCVVPELVAKMDLFSNELTYGTPPIAVNDFNLEILWETRNDQNAKNLWLRELVKASISEQVAQLRLN